MHRRSTSDDAGFTLVEVIVAMVVFAIIVTGFLYTVTASLTLTRDTRARIVAANLASQQIDLVRSAASVFDVTSSTRSVTLNGDVFHVAVDTSWATSAGGTATCEAGVATSGSLLYKQVTVEVTWDNMPVGTAPVYSDTSLTPKAKINDPTRGTVLVGVIDSAGDGVSGATVSLSPSGGVAAVTTDSDGCAYLLKVPAATYTVSVTKTGYVSDGQVASPTATVNVAAGSSSRVSFGYDKATTFKATYVNATTAATLAAANLPTNLGTSFLSTYGNFLFTASSATNPQNFALYPISSGYSVVSGAYAETLENVATSCLAPDPGQWVQTSTLVSARPAAVAGLPGATVTVSVPLGVFTLANAGTISQKYLTAVYAGGGAGDPGCGAGMTYKFGNILTTSGSVTAALPPGTWKLYRGAIAGDKTTQLTGGVTAASTGTFASNLLTLDPRVAP